jgi:hypothetical protein
LTRVVVHDTHLSGSGWVQHSTGPVYPGVDLDVRDVVADKRATKRPRMTITEFALAGVTLGPSGRPLGQPDSRPWPSMPDAVFTVPMEP